ncbi:MAG: hypothetical protein IKY83_11295 [Proteobacteria bacterium]|nr:hypothetical protein [Pseudomonadota bacterium]
MNLFKAALLSFCLVPSVAFAQSPADALFDKVLNASHAATCEETQSALEKISDEEIVHALSAIKSQQIQGEISVYEEKIDQIITLSAKCPDAQSAFVTRMSRQALALQIKQRPAEKRVDAPDATQMAPLFRWLDVLQDAIESASCADLPAKLAAIDPEINRQAATVMRSTSPNRLDPKTKAEIQSKMRAIYHSVQSCPNARQEIDKMIDGMMFAK